MLFAERMLVRYDNLGREGAVLKDLEKKLPSDLHEIYEHLLSECDKRTAPSRRPHVKTLLAWAAFSFRPLVLDEAVSLLKHVSQDENFELDEIPEPFVKFLRIGDPVFEGDTELPKNWNKNIKDIETSEREKDDAGSNGADKKYDDGMLPVKFQERSMRSFFRDGPHGEKKSQGLRWSKSAANRQIFLTSAKLAMPTVEGVKVDLKLQRYVSSLLYMHFQEIEPAEHTAAENKELLDCFWRVFSNQTKFANMMMWIAADYSRLNQDFFDKVQVWAKLAPELASEGLGEDALKWWGEVAAEPRRVLLDLAKGHVAKFFKATNPTEALQAYNPALTALQEVSVGPLGGAFGGLQRC
jgi:hypothetical protein